MNYVKVELDGDLKGIHYGLLEGEDIYILKRSPLETFGSPEKTGQKTMLKDAKRFFPPVQAKNIIALGLNYLEHAKESGNKLPPAPVVFLKSISALSAHLEEIILPAEAPDFVDYEAELVIVIGKTCKNVPEDAAAEYILGYTCGNDVSARDCQLKIDLQWARGKSFDTFAPIGPYIVDDINPDNLRITSRVNGKIMQDSNTADMIFGTYQIVSYLSRQMTLLPGTIIMTGTPSGVGSARKPPVFLRHGDTVEIEIEGIGVLKNSVCAEKNNVVRQGF